METVIVDTFAEALVVVVQLPGYLSAVCGLLSFAIGVGLWWVVLAAFRSGEVL